MLHEHKDGDCFCICVHADEDLYPLFVTFCFFCCLNAAASCHKLACRTGKLRLMRMPLRHRFHQPLQSASPLINPSLHTSLPQHPHPHPPPLQNQAMAPLCLLTLVRGVPSSSCSGPSQRAGVSRRGLASAQPHHSSRAAPPLFPQLPSPCRLRGTLLQVSMVQDVLSEAFVN